MKRGVIVGIVFAIVLTATNFAFAKWSTSSANTAKAYAKAMAVFPVTCSPQTVSGILPSDDNYISVLAPNTVNGPTLPTMIVATSTGVRRAVVRYQLPALPSGCTVTSATMNLAQQSTITGRTIKCFRINPGVSWTEGNATWNLLNGSAVGTSSDAVMKNSQWDVTGIVQGWYANGNSGLICQDAAEANNNQVDAFYTKEENVAGDQRPKLTVTFG